jgi:hypothetical protein
MNGADVRVIRHRMRNGRGTGTASDPGIPAVISGILRTT